MKLTGSTQVVDPDRGADEDPDSGPHPPMGVLVALIILGGAETKPPKTSIV